MADRLEAQRIWAGTAGEKPGRHLDHDFFTDEQGRDRVENKLADDVARAVVRPDLFSGRGIASQIFDRSFDVFQGQFYIFLLVLARFSVGLLSVGWGRVARRFVVHRNGRFGGITLSRLFQEFHGTFEVSRHPPKIRACDAFAVYSDVDLLRKFRWQVA